MISSRRIYESGVAWTASYDWDVFGTLTFAPGRKLRSDIAEKYWSRFWNDVDRAAFGKNAGYRVPRMVFAQYGALGDNPHIHFLAKAPIHKQKFCIYLNAIWAGIDQSTSPPSGNEILPVLDVERASEYAWHEYWRNGPDTMHAGLSHLNDQRRDGTGLVTPHLQAERRLAELANGVWLKKAQQAFVAHVLIAQDRYQKRDK
jgi:hypothetical protein